MKRRLAIGFLIGALLGTITAWASVTVTVNGSNYTIPQNNEKGWGTNVTSWIQSMSANTLQPTGGTFTLLSDVDFGASFGLKPAYVKSRSASPATVGLLRLSNSDTFGWRNAGNTADLLLGTSSDRLTYGGVTVPTISSTDTLTNKSISGASNTLSAIGDGSLSVSYLKADGSRGLTSNWNAGSFSGTFNGVSVGSSANTISGISTLTNGGSNLTLPSSADTLVGRATTDALTNKDIDGGTASNTSRITLPKAAKATLDGLTRKQGTVVFASDLNKAFVDNGSTLTAMGGGGGGLFDGGQNVLSNSSWETDTSGWTASGGTYTRNTAVANLEPPGVGSASWDSSSASQTLTSTAVTVTSADGLSGKNGVVSATFKCASGTCTHKLQAYDGTNVLAEATITSSTTGFVRTSVNFIIPSSGTIQGRLISVASDEPAVYIDQAYLGLAEGFNLSQVSQATFYGSVKTPSTSGCFWNTASVSSAAPATPSATASCPTPTLSGNASAPGTKIPAISFASLPPGVYHFEAHGFFRQNSNNRCSFRFSDGTNSTPGVMIGMATGGSEDSIHPTIAGDLIYTTAQSNVTIAIQMSGASATASACQIDASSTEAGSVVGLEITAYRFPTSSETVVRSDSTPASWSGTISAPSGGCSTTSGTFVDPSACTSSALTENTNRNFGSVAIASGPLPGITFTPPRVGNYLVCVNGTYNGSASGQNYAVRLLDPNSTQLSVSTSLENSVGGSLSYSMCGVSRLSSLTPATFKTQGIAQSGTMSFTGGALSTMQSWNVVQLDAAFPTPVYVGSVTSNTSGQERVERATIACYASSGGVTLQSGSWVSTSARSAGCCTLTFAAGIFSGTPTCVSSRRAASLAEVITTAPSSSTSSTVCDSAANDFDASIICMGPR